MNRFLVIALFIALAVGTSVISFTHAAVISVQPQVGGFYTTTFDPIPPQPFYNHPVVVQIDVFMEVLSLAPGEDSFGLAAFSFYTEGACNCQLKPSEDAGGWNPAPHPNVDSNGPAPGGLVPLFATNADLGTSSVDYEGVLVQMATGAFTNALDPRRSVGEPGSPLGVPIMLGSAFFEWNGTGIGSITLDPVQAAVKRSDGIFVIAQAAPVQPVQLGPGDCPEPSSVVMLGGMLALAGLRRQVG
jgi:hypothetical protein